MKLKAVSGIMLTLLTIGMLTLAFDIQPVKASGTIYIRADGSIEGTTDISTVDNVTYTFTDNIYDEIVVERDNIVVDGAGYTVQGTGSGTGVDLTWRNNITIKNMKIRDFYYGIYLYRSSNNHISQNEITPNNLRGIRLCESSNNTISGNTVTNNLRGIWLEESSSNTFYHNNFVGNIEQVRSYNSTNVWDDGYPSGGNYWSDYIDVDQYSGPYQNETGSDGIWDHPYIIDENNRDNYPLALEHELAVSLTASPCILLGKSSLLKAIVYNRGSSNETDVKLQLLINDIIVANVTIPELISGSSHTLNYLWTPTIEGTYNVTAYAPPVPDEAATTNNVEMKDVSAVTTIAGTYISVEPHANTGVNFTVTAMVFNITDLMGFQVALYYDASVINMTSASLPADHVLAGQPGLDLGPEYRYFDSWGVGMAGFACYAGATSFSGDGKLVVFEFEIIAAPPEEGSLTSSLIISTKISPFPYETKLKDSEGEYISFVGIDGYFVYPSILPGDLNSDGVVDIDDLVVAVLAFGGYPGHPRWSLIADLTKDGIVDVDDIVTIAVHFGDHL